MEWKRRKFKTINLVGLESNRYGWIKNGIGIKRCLNGMYEIYHLKSGLLIGRYWEFEPTKQKVNELLKLEDWNKEATELKSQNLESMVYETLEMEFLR